MKNKKVEISKINIKIGDKEIPLTLAEAQELRQILDETFGQKTVYLPSAPIVIERPIYPQTWYYWTVTCGDSVSSNAGTITLSNNTGGTFTDLLSPMLVS